MFNFLFCGGEHLIYNRDVRGMDEQHPSVTEIPRPLGFHPQPREVLNIPPSASPQWVGPVSRPCVEQHFRDVIKGLVALVGPSKPDRTRYITVLSGEAAQVCHPL